MKYILDSSVIAKLIFKEERSDLALQLIEQSYLKDIEYYASDLIFYEVGNVLWKNLRKIKKSGVEYINQLFLLNITFNEISKDIAIEAMKISQKNDFTFYDSVHLALSNINNSKLVTEDKELLKRSDIAINIEDALNEIWRK